MIPTLSNTLWAAFTLFVPLTLIANLTVALLPRKRGIGFMPQLRYAIVTPACLVIALLVAPFLPYFTAHPISGSGAILLGIIGLLQITGVVAALRSERVPPPGPDRLPFAIPRALFDADHRFLTLPGGERIHYVDEGTGPTLLFLHGNPAWSFQWRDLIGGLQDSYRCIALDYPGFGLSSAPPGYGFTPREQSHVLEAFVDHLGLTDVTLVMQDWGGPIGLSLAGRRPELIQRIVLGNTWAWPTHTSEVRGKFSKIVGGPLGEFLQMNFNAFAMFALQHGVVRKLPQEIADLYLHPFRTFSRRGVAAFYPSQITAATDYLTDVAANLSHLRDRPALFFWGLRDLGFPRTDLERFQQAFPNHHTIELPDADHFFFEDATERMIQEIRTFASEPSCPA